MNKKLQNEIREFIGDDPAKAVERVRESGLKAEELEEQVFYPNRDRHTWIDTFTRIYGDNVYTAGVSAVMRPEYRAMYNLGHSLPRFAAILWAAAWIVEVNEND